MVRSKLSEENICLGNRVELNASALSLSYVKSRQSYTYVYPGKKGTIKGMSETGKYAIEFDTYVFDPSAERKSSHNHGCHGKGKLHFCWYFPASAFDLIEQKTEQSNNDLILVLR